MARPLHISQGEINIQARKILLPAKYGESGVGLCYPGCKIGYILSALLDNPVVLRKYLGNYYHRFQFIPVELTSKSTLRSFNADVNNLLTHKGLKVSSQATLEQMVEKLLVEGREPYFFVLNGQVVKENNLGEILSQIHVLIERYPRVGGMLFLERNIHEEPYQHMLQDNYKYLQNIEYFPIYSEGESRNFLQTLAHEWRLKVSEKTVKEMVNQCGGVLWLLREALRRVRDEGEMGVKNLGMFTISRSYRW